MRLLWRADLEMSLFCWHLHFQEWIVWRKTERGKLEVGFAGRMWWKVSDVSFSTLGTGGRWEFA